MPTIIYHLAFRDDWEAGLAAGEYRAPSLAEEGFIHASGDEAQTLRVAARLFAGSTDLLVLDVDTVLLGEGSPEFCWVKDHRSSGNPPGRGRFTRTSTVLSHWLPWYEYGSWRRTRIARRALRCSTADERGARFGIPTTSCWRSGG